MPKIKRQKVRLGPSLLEPNQLGSKPDDVVHGPGFRLERQGRYITISSHRTEDEHRRLMAALVKSRAGALAEIERRTVQIVNLIHQYNSLELLSHVALLNMSEDPNSYKEYSSKIRPPYVEHLALLELKDPKYELRSMHMPDGLTVETVQRLLDEIFHMVPVYWAAIAADPDRKVPPTKLEELRFRQRLNELAVRSPTYYDHWVDTLRALYGPPFLVARMKAVLGFDIESALRLIAAIPRLMQGRLRSRIAEAQKQHEKVRREVYDYKRTGKFSGPEELREIANNLRNLPDKECKESIKGITMTWAFFDLEGTFSFGANELAVEAAVSVDVAEKFLDFFSVPFGSTSKDFMLPELTHELKVRPIIRYEGRFICPVPHLLLWAVKPAIESRFKAEGIDAHDSSNAFWERYQRHRADFLVLQSLAYFRMLLPKAQVFEKLRYKVSSPQGERNVELDGLVLFDRYAFFIEAKAGEFSLPARRGAPDRLVRDLKDLVAEPHAQARRAIEYVSSAAEPVFVLADGYEVKLDKIRLENTFQVAVSLDHFDAHTASSFELREIGLLEIGERPWSINLSDLRILAETVSTPIQFTHYLNWRLHLNCAGQIYGHDELNWYGVYLAEGPRLLEVPNGYDQLSFTSYLTEFDDYYLYEMGQRTKPAKRPSQYLPKPVASLLAGLEALGGQGHTAVGEKLLDLDFEQRDRLAALVIKVMSNSARSLAPEFFRFPGFIVELRSFETTFDECKKAAVDLCAYHGCEALVFSIKGLEPPGLHAWGCSNGCLSA